MSGLDNLSIEESIERSRILGSPNLLLTFPKIWEDFADIFWQKELYDGREIRKYHFVAKGPNFHVEKFLQQHENSFRLVGLTPGEIYTVAVRALADDDAWSDWRVVDVQTAERAKLKVGQIGATFINGNFTWGTVVENTLTYTYLPAAKFQLKVRQKEAVLDSNVADQMLPGNKREFKLNHLKVDSTFMVQIRAISEYDDLGAWSPETRFLTLNDLRVWIDQLGEDYAVIKWERQDVENMPAEDSSESIPEFLIRLELEPEQREKDIDSNVKPSKIADLRFDHSKNSHRLQDLRPGRAYYLHYRHRNILGDWADWKAFHFVTLSPVAQVEMVCVGQDFIHFTWMREETKLEFADGSDVRHDGTGAKGCKVQAWQVMATDCATHEFTSMDLPAEEHVTKLVSLVPGREYCIRVRARTIYGEWGPPSIEKYVSTLPPLYARVESRGENWLHVAWDRKEKTYPDDITRYHLQLTGVNAPFRLSKYFEPHEQSFTFTGLKIATQYYVTVQACIGLRWSPWSEANLTCTLSPPPVRLSRRGEDFIQVKWACPPGSDVDPTEAKYQLRVTKCRSFDHKDPTEPASSSAPPLEIVNEEMVGTTLYRLSKLAYKRRYAFSVRMWDPHLKLWGNWSSEAVFSTLDSAVTFTDVAETYFEVTWQAQPRIISKAMNGAHADDIFAPEDVQKYILRISEVHEYDRTTEIGKFHFAKGDRTHHVVSNLTPNTTYSAQIMVCDICGTWSPWSAPAYITTIAPLEVSVLDIGEDYASIAWEREPSIMPAETIVPDDADMEFNICLTEVSLVSSDKPQESSLNYTAVGCSGFVIRHLTPRTSYRLQMRSCPLKSKVWGVWSQPIYIRTVDPVEVALDLVGEEYAHISWQRAATDTTEVKMPIIVVAGNGQRVTPNDMALYQGNQLLCGDPSVTEFHLKVFTIDNDATPKAVNDDSDGRKLHLETFANGSQSYQRLPRLQPNTRYEVCVRASNRRGEWGCWSSSMQFTTMMPTEISVTEITLEYVRVAWGKKGRHMQLPGEDTDADVGEEEPAVDGSKHQLRVVGRDDNFSKEITIEPNVHDYCIAGFNVNCCYSIQLRTFIPEDDLWGRWSTPIFLAVRTVPVELLESSQGAMRVCWKNPQAKDLRAKRQFVTRIGDGKAVTLALPGEAIEHVFTDLIPATPYSVHLLVLEQVPQYIPFGGGQSQQQRAIEHLTPPPATHSEVSHTPVSLPVVAYQHDTFKAASATFTTLYPIKLDIIKLGENFISLQWRREQDSKAGIIPLGAISELEADYEVDLREGPQVDPFSASLPSPQGTSSIAHRQVRGNQLTLTQLKAGTEYSIAVRQVSRIPTNWSAPVLVRTLQKLTVQISDGLQVAGVDVDGSKASAKQGIGEGFMVLAWDADLSKLPPGTKFQVRVVPMDRHGISLGYADDLDDVDHLPDGVLLLECTDPHLHIPDLEPDTLYRVNIRSIILENRQPMYGYWSDDKFIATLAPMAVKVASVAEEHCQMKWKRKGVSRQKGLHNDTTSLLNVSRYHVRVLRCPDDLPLDGPPSPSLHSIAEVDFNDKNAIVFQQEYSEGDPEFGNCSAMVTMLKPNTKYAAQVRASTNNYWGTWSQPVTFYSCLPLVLKVPLIGESSCFLEWGRDTQQKHLSRPPTTNTELQDEADLDETLEEETVAEAQVEKFEVHVWTVGKDRHTLTNTVNAMRGKHHLRSLQHNSHYAVTVRAFYTTGLWGPLSNQVYFATLPPMAVHVGRIGESFVHVRWERLPQLRVTNKLRTQYRQQQAEFEVNQAQIQSRLDWLQQQIFLSGATFSNEMLPPKPKMAPVVQKDFNDPLSLEDLLDGGVDEEPEVSSIGHNHMSQLTQQHIQEMQQLQHLMVEQQQQQRELTRLQQMQLQELERETLYPEGDDVQYEVVIMGTIDEELFQQMVEKGITPPPAEGTPRGPRPFRFKKTMPKGSLACKMEGLFPHSTYSVTVRAMFTNGFDVLGLDTSAVEEDPASPHPSADPSFSPLFWGEWAEGVSFMTLKQVTLKVLGAGSAHCCLEWDTGYTPTDNSPQITAISQFHIQLVEKPSTVSRVMGREPKVELFLDNPMLRSFTVIGLQSNQQYSVSIRVCYEEDKWGLWSNSVDILTLCSMRAKMKTISENLAELLVWRDPQTFDGDCNWRPKSTEHQLSVNGIPSPSTFNLDLDTSTLLTLGDLTTDTEFRIQVREKDVNQEWREWTELVVFETLPFAPSKPTLEERKGTHIAINWTLKRNCANAAYVYCVEMAYLQKKPKRGVPVEHDPFQVMGILYEQTLRIELGPLDLPRCLFRVKAAKEHQSLEGRRYIDDSAMQPQGDVSQYLWGRYSPTAQFKAPSIPDHPTGLRIVHLRDTNAVVRWKKPDNHHLHTNLVYKIYLNQTYGERFVCVGQTDAQSFLLTGLTPNNHYRVAVTAESNMGVSTGNNALIFSTRPSVDGVDNPLSSAVPARVPLKVPAGFDWTVHDPIKRALQEAADPSRMSAPIIAPRMSHPNAMTPVAAPSSIRLTQGSVASLRTGVARHRPASAEEPHVPNTEWALEQRSNSAGPFSSNPSGPFLPSLSANSWIVSQPLPQMNNYVSDNDYDAEPPFPEDFGQYD